MNHFKHHSYVVLLQWSERFFCECFYWDAFWNSLNWFSDSSNWNQGIIFWEWILFCFVLFFGVHSFSRIERNISDLIIYMKKFLHSDWLRAVQLFLKQCRKELIQCKKKKQTKHSDWSMIRETHRWPIKSFAFKSSACPGWRNWWRNFSLIAWYACVSSA